MDKPRCVVLDGWTLTEHTAAALPIAGEPSWQALAELVDLTVFARTAYVDVPVRAEGAELILTNKVILDRAQLEQLPQLRYIGVLATGTNVVDLQHARTRKIMVTNAPGYATESVVAHVFASMLALELRLCEYARAVKDGSWSRSPDFTFRLGSTLELAGRTLGVVGFGNIGKRVAEVGMAFGMRVLAATRADSERPLPAWVERAPVDRIFAEADVVTLHCPLVPETTHLVNARRLASMKSDAILINTGRGPLVDELALADALERGTIRGAALDVLSIEPPAPEHPLLSVPRCLITPHTAWATRAARLRLMDIVTSNVAGFLSGNVMNQIA
jgi:glycerate dehydrogenase